MKSLIIPICVILIIGRIVTGATELTDACYMELYQQSVRADQCRGNELQSDLMQSEFNRTLIGSNGDENSITIFTNKFCAAFRKFIDCTPIAWQNLSAECSDFPQIDEQIFRNRLLGIIVNYTCDNDAKNLKSSLRDEGYKIWVNQDFQTCLNERSLTTIRNKESKVFQVNPAWCASLRTSKDCVINFLSSHQNTDLVKLVNNLYTKLAEEGPLNCLISDH